MPSAGDRSVQIIGGECMRVVIAAIAIALLILPAQAQMGGGMGGKGGRGHHSQAQKTEAPKKKVDDKAYKAALDRLPDKKVDPWADKH
jgi:hypothetical protein